MEQNSFNWGRPTLFIKDLSVVNAKFKRLPTPIEDSTELTPTRGEKKDGTVEGGEIEVSKRKKSTYELAYSIRKLAGRKPPFKTVDGVTNHEFAILMMPEDNNADGFYIERSSASIDDPFKAADGAPWDVLHSALKPTSGNTVKWGKVTVSGTQVSFVENEDELLDGESQKTFTELFEDNDSTVTPIYYQVQADDVTGKNPKLNGWYVKDGSTYTLTTDTEPQQGTTYYVKA